MNMPESNLRERNAAATRESVMQATVELLESESLDRVTMPAIAQASGISLRTLYRYYPDREALSLALGRWVDQHLLETGLPATPDAVAAQMEEVGEKFEAHVELIRALVGGPTSGDRTPRRGERLDAIAAALADSTRSLRPAERRRLIAIVQLLASAPAWLAVRDEGGLAGEEASDALAWAIRSLLQTTTDTTRTRKGARHDR